MDSQAFAVLEAISRGACAEGPDSQRWIDAFKTIRWVVEGREGPVLTPEGRLARDQIAMERRSKVGAPKPPVTRSASPPRRAAIG